MSNKVLSSLLHLNLEYRTMLILTAAVESRFVGTYSGTGQPDPRASVNSPRLSVMPMDSPKRRQLAVALACRAGKESAPGQIAHWIALMCEEIAGTLAPILGRSCVTAVYHGSLLLTGKVHPWLAHLHDRIRASMDLTQLKSVLGEQSSGIAAAGGCALLQGIRDLLASLIGASTTERLLHAVWEDFYSGPSPRARVSRIANADQSPNVLRLSWAGA